MAKTMKFNGIIYNKSHVYKNKNSAYRMAEYWRKGGHNARVIQEKTGYELYITKKIR